MKNLKIIALKTVKQLVDKNTNVNLEANSKCLAIMYQPKRKISAVDKTK